MLDSGILAGMASGHHPTMRAEERLMRAKFVAGVGVCALVVPAIAWAQTNGGNAERNWAAIEQCAAVRDADRRHECIDGVLQQAGILSSQQVAQEVRGEFGKEDRPAPRPAPAPVVAARAQPDAAPARAADLDELVTSVASTRAIGYQRVRVTTADGSVWDQTQAESFSAEPKQGDRFSVERAAMDSFLCQFGRSSRYRCQRTD
jgi:hypothetical protein